MSSFTCSPMELPEILFVGISLSRYIISPRGNCNEIKGCLYLLTLQISSLRYASALEAPRTIRFCIAMLSVSFLWLWKKGTDSDSCIHPAAAGACGQEACRSWRRGCQLHVHHHLPDTDQNLLTSVAHYKLVIPQFCPLESQGWGAVRDLDFFFFQSVQSCP